MAGKNNNPNTSQGPKSLFDSLAGPRTRYLLHVRCLECHADYPHPAWVDLTKVVCECGGELEPIGVIPPVPRITPQQAVVIGAKACDYLYISVPSCPFNPSELQQASAYLWHMSIIGAWLEGGG
jgi:hypothetical protein